MHGCNRLNAISFFKNAKNSAEQFVRAEVEEHLKTINLLNNEVARKMGEIETINYRISAMQRENRHMKAQYDLERDRTRALDETNAALRAELSRFSHLAGQVAEINRENDRLLETNSALKMLTNQQQYKIDSLEVQNSTIREDHERFKRQNSRKDDFLTTNVHNLAIRRSISRDSNHEKEIIELKEENWALQNELREKIVTMRDLSAKSETSKVVSLIAQVKSLEADKKSLMEERNDLSGRLEEVLKTEGTTNSQKTSFRARNNGEVSRDNVFSQTDESIFILKVQCVEKNTQTEENTISRDSQTDFTGTTVKLSPYSSDTNQTMPKSKSFVDDKPFVLPPMKLKVEREFNKGLMISWTSPPSPTLPNENQFFDVYFNSEKMTSIPATNKPKYILEDIEYQELSRISVVNRIDPQNQSEPSQCTLLIGRGSSSAPSNVRVESMTGYSVVVRWLPGNSNCHHILYIDDSDMAFIKSGIVRATISHLLPLTQYRLKITSVFIDSQKKQRITCDSETVLFRTTEPCAFNVPTGLLIEPGPQVETLLVSWRPPPEKDSFCGPKGYALYFDGELVKKVTGPKSDFVILSARYLRKGLARKATIRTTSYDGTETADSTPFEITKQLIWDVFQISEPFDKNFSPDPQSHSKSSLKQEFQSCKETIHHNKSQKIVDTGELSGFENKAKESHFLSDFPEQGVTYNLANPPRNQSRVRYFLALYTYDPYKMSPNQETMDEEIAFMKDDVIKVYGEIDSDGFYQGECRDRFGYIPSNVVEEITDLDKIEEFKNPKNTKINPGQTRTDLYVAILDYDPVSAINITSNMGKQLRMRRGEAVLVKGPPNQHGFCLAESKEVEGYVPINYLRRASNIQASHLNLAKIKNKAINEFDSHSPKN